MSKFKRKRLWVDPKVQGTLILRVLAYWVSCLFTVALLGRVVAGMSRIFPGMENQTWLPYMPAILASAFFLPLVVQDTLRLSNRFVGPMFRLRRSVRALADGERVRKVHFRDGDMWQDFADDFNDLVTRLDMEKTKDDDGDGKGDWKNEPAESTTPEEQVLQASTELLDQTPRAEMTDVNEHAESSEATTV